MMLNMCADIFYLPHCIVKNDQKLILNKWQLDNLWSYFLNVDGPDFMIIVPSVHYAAITAYSYNEACML